MLKALIICHDFPPHPSIAAKRPYAWHQYLPNHGIDTTVVCGVRESADRQLPHTIYTDLLPHSYQRNIVATTYRRFRSLIGLVFGSYVFRLSRKYAIYKAAKSALRLERFDIIIATAEPYILFAFAKKLSKEFNIPWIADYRDNWSNEPTASTPLLLRLFFRWMEHTTVSTACQITTVGQPTAQRIRDIVPDVPVAIIENGHLIPTDFAPEPTPTAFLKIAYLGRLYKHRDPDLFFQACQHWLSLSSAHKLELWFYGMDDYPVSLHELQQASARYDINIRTTPNLHYGDMLREASSAHALLLLASPQIPLTNGKFYDYLGLSRPILLCPSDESIFAAFIDMHKCGFSCNTVEEVVAVLNTMWQQRANETFFYTPEDGSLYHRRHSTALLAKLIKSHISA